MKKRAPALAPRSCLLVAALGMAALTGCSTGEAILVNMSAEVEGSGIVTSEPGGIFCRGGAGSSASGVCSATFTARNARLELVATPSAGWTFKGWDAQGERLDTRYGDIAYLSVGTERPHRVRAVFEQESVEQPDGGTDGGTEPDTDVGEEVVLRARATGTASNLRSATWFPGDGDRESLYLLAAGNGEVVVSADLKTFETVTIANATGAAAKIVATHAGALYLSGTNAYGTFDGRNFGAIGPLPELQSVEVAFAAEGRFVVGGTTASNQGAILTSLDGFNWNVAWSGAQRPLSGTHHPDHGFLVGTRGGSLLHSSNGTAWTVRTVGATTRDLFAIAASSERVLALAGDAGEVEVVSSTDAVSWTRATGSFPAGAALRDLAHAAPYFVAVANGGRVFSSEDGSAWLPNLRPTQVDLVSLNATGPVLVAVGSAGFSGFALKELSGERVDSGAGPDIQSVAWFPGTEAREGQYLLGRSDGKVVRVRFGRAPAEVTTGATGTTALVAASPTLALLADGKTIFGSTDGITWASRATVSAIGVAQTLTYGEGRFILTGSNGTTGAGGMLFSSTDGITWTELERGPHPITAAHHHPGAGFVATLTLGGWAWSQNGATWDVADSKVTTTTFTAIAASAGRVIASGRASGVTELFSFDRVAGTWARVENGLPGDFEVNSLRYTPPVFIASGSDGRRFVSVDSFEWKESPAAASPDVLFIGVGGPLPLEVGRSGMIRTIQW